MEIKNIKLLVVDDDKEIAKLAAIYLKEDGYEVFTAYSGKEALTLMQTQEIHLAILDIMMPGMDGFEVCRYIRQKSNIPIIMLSARSNDDDKVEGLSSGADDYVVKPFSPLELKARVKSQLRRFMVLNTSPENADNTTKEQEFLQRNQLTINLQTHEVTSYGKEVTLTPTEFKILYFLASNAGEVFSTDQYLKLYGKKNFMRQTIPLWCIFGVSVKRLNWIPEMLKY